MRAGHDATLDEINQRLVDLQHEAELIKTVLIVKEPNTIHAAEAFDGLRKQVIATMSERRAHVNQLVTMSVALSRAATLDDIRAQVGEWLAQADVRCIDSLDAVPRDAPVNDLLEDVDGGSLEGAEVVEILEPIYVDGINGMLLRRGRARVAKSATRRPSAVLDDVVEPETGAEDGKGAKK
jgi:hypothetical protein